MEAKIGHGPQPPIPQRDRVTFLVRLSEMFGPVVGLMTAFAVIDGFMVLNVISQNHAERTVTVGCGYRDGRWWFHYVHTNELIRPADELTVAAHHIRTRMERTGR
ncbi:hypothetical protein GCM10022254_28010 [Actinomadura meridiana]|uniref:Uncharacterized protein n=1 Tax=Actinomadura meridiana TaxID=559626 RepID=A0ABP8C0E2_9ACTN